MFLKATKKARDKLLESRGQEGCRDLPCNHYAGYFPLFFHEIAIYIYNHLNFFLMLQSPGSSHIIFVIVLISLNPMKTFTSVDHNSRESFCLLKNGRSNTFQPVRKVNH